MPRFSPVEDRELLEVLRELVAEVKGLRADWQQQHGRHRTLSRADREQLSRLLPVIATTQGSELFTTAEVLTEPSPALALVLDGISARALGRLLRRAVGVSVDGLLVQADGSEAHRTLWRVVQVL
jgi:hypothetical protein